MYQMRKCLLSVCLVFIGLASLAPDSRADEAAAAQVVVDDANRTFTRFIDDPNMVWFRDNLHKARGMMIVPKLGRGGFIIGGSGGRGLALGRDSKTGRWSQPVFYTIGSASIGLQIGGEQSEVILLIMSNRGLDAMLGTKAQLGADMSVAAGPVGTGTRAATADVLSFARSKGAFAGLTVEGSIITPDAARNTAYYGKAVSPLDILIRHSASNPRAGELVKNVTGNTPKK
ncbi:MAG: lipid-binding SYLF domain-containing protein [Gammaproteobacteria bacterium]|nr:MAG: lipid-binding SYLF domain-containing protein [Gammaproteobacteria bacterium]